MLQWTGSESSALLCLICRLHSGRACLRNGRDCDYSDGHPDWFVIVAALAAKLFDISNKLFKMIFR
jgi:hypothetical protein